MKEKPTPGDRIIVSRANGWFDLLTVTDAGEENVREGFQGFGTWAIAGHVARADLTPGATIWRRSHGVTEPL